MSKHTPGKFDAVKRPTGSYDIRGGKGWRCIASVWRAGKGEREANARLFSASPDLLAALREFLECGNTTETQELARRAIAKAEG